MCRVVGGIHFRRVKGEKEGDGGWEQEDCVEHQGRDVLFATSDNRQIHS